MQPRQIVLDTSAYSRMRSGHEPVIEWLAAAVVVYVPAIVLGELSAGFRLGARRKENEQVLAEFLREPFVQVRDVDVEVSRRYGEVFADLRRAGTPIPTNDVWIAASTLAVGGHLVTFDGDFAQVANLPHTVLE